MEFICRSQSCLHLAPGRQPHQHPTTLAPNNDPAQGLHTLKSGLDPADEDLATAPRDTLQTVGLHTA